MEYTGLYKPVIGISGGVDSTLVMLASARALQKLGLPGENLVAVTMPCFGTTDRTKNNAITIAEQLGATLRIIDIGDSVKEHFLAIGHDFDNKNVVFENAQAGNGPWCSLISRTRSAGSTWAQRTFPSRPTAGVRLTATRFRIMISTPE
jgi:3'-phosphoadenosine 5'-phosphosulfate sulfotransferase (PAPS reductase)/FAD synthetase